MPLDTARIRQHLKSFDFRSLFVEELGWDRYKAQPLPISIDGSTYSLQAQAEKRGMVIFVCQADGARLPDYTARRKIEKQVAKAAYEHVIIYTDALRTTQIWQWVRREKGRPNACREHTLHKGQPGDALVQKLQILAFSIEEEENTTLTGVTGRARRAFDVDRVTKQFYDRFKKEHATFLKFIKGIQTEGDREWYASLMLNRLMFVYFIQKKGFLDGDIHYLRNRLQMTVERKGKDRFLSFYRYFLLRLFHEGLGHPKHSPELEALLGKVPYLNGGLFEVHELESNYPSIDIPDEAFEKMFGFFDAYHWHLDERPLRADNEINPDVLGYIFEKYINQKQMGAYYTKEDITEYISKNTIIPFLFEAAEKKCSIAFKPEGSVWRLLKDDADRYIYEAVRKGVDLVLPEGIAAGLNEVSKRGGWNRLADPEFALPTETWREHVARRQRCLELRRKLAAGEVHTINDLITYNLDIRTFAEDVIWNCEEPELLRAICYTIAGFLPEKSNEKFEGGVSILDPTCGSGAFLFAALNILGPLYQACLTRMESFIEDHDRAQPGQSAKFADFRKVLERVDQHPNQRYFVLKSIILGNLYGVDIMEEAVEICKLRLFLKLVAEVEPDSSKPNLGLEPLPDIDFNIRAGNTLVGFANEESLKRHFSEADHGQQRMLSAEETALIARIDETADIAGRAYQRFREMQTKHEMAAENFLEAKKELRRRLKALGDELDRYLAADYGIDRPRFKNTKEWDSAFADWRSSHQPFHWSVEFYGIMKRGGFDVIIGNPPYVVYSPSKVSYSIEPHGYETLPAKNLYAFVFERSTALAAACSGVGLIVQLTVLSSESLPSLQNLLLKRGRIYAISFPRRPESIFDGVEMPVAILLSYPDSRSQLATTRVMRFYTEERAQVMKPLRLIQHDVRRDGHRIGKFSSDLEIAVYKKIAYHHLSLGQLTTRRSDSVVYYQEACRYWVKAQLGLPFFKRNGQRIDPPHGRFLYFRENTAASFTTCLLNSSLFYWMYSAFSDCEHINDSFIKGINVPSAWTSPDWRTVAQRLMSSLKSNSRRKTISTQQGHTIEYEEIKALHSKEVIDELDRELGALYGFRDEELDFIINYDIKYRMGREAEEVEDE